MDYEVLGMLRAVMLCCLFLAVTVVAFGVGVAVGRRQTASELERLGAENAELQLKVRLWEEQWRLEREKR